MNILPYNFAFVGKTSNKHFNSLRAEFYYRLGEALAENNVKSYEALFAHIAELMSCIYTIRDNVVMFAQVGI